MDKQLSSVDKPWIKSYPSHINWSTKLHVSSIFDGLKKSSETNPNRDAIIFMGKKWTYEQTILIVNKCIYGLQKIGVKKGDRIAIALPNSPYYIFFFYACTAIGAIVVNINPLHTVNDILEQVSITKPKLIITINVSDIFKKIEKACEFGTVEKIVLCSIQDVMPIYKRVFVNLFKRNNISKVSNSKKIFPYKKLINNSGTFTKNIIDPKEDIAILQFTGGTTGIIKAAKLTHANITSNINQIISWNDETKSNNDKVLAILPFFHIFGLTIAMLAPIKEAATLVIMPKFEIKESLKNIENYKISYLPGVPTIFGALKEYPEIKKFNLKSIKLCFSGGAPLPKEVKNAFEGITGCKIIEGYGLSETSPVVTINPINGKHKSGSAGIPVQNTEVQIRVLDGLDRITENGKAGEVCIKGPQLMQGYWDKEDQEDIFSDNFFRTGDIGYLDEDGYLFLVDRIKDIIIASGYNIYPSKIEAAIYQHPNILEAVVIGVPDDHRGETPKAFIKLKENKILNKKQLLSFLSDKLSSIEKPTHIEFRDEMPKTIVGKLSKEALRNEYNLRGDKDD